MKVLWFNVLHNLKSHHYTTSATIRVWDLASTLWLPIYGNMHRESNINPLSTESIPSWYGLINTNPLRDYENILSVLIKNIYHIINEHPTMLSMGYRPSSLHLKALQSLSNLCLGIPVKATSFTAGIYFLFCETGDHSQALEVVSNLVINTMTLNNL